MAFRRSTARNLPRQPTPVTDGPAFSLSSVIRLLYPHGPHDELGARAQDVLGDRPVDDAASVRLILSSLDRQAYPSPFQVRFGPEDVVELELEGVRLALDRHDQSVSAQIMAAQAYEPHLTAVFKRFLQPGMTVVDIGANVGYYSLLSAKLVGPTGRVVAVEPNSENCRLILLSAALNDYANIDLRPVALDTEAGWSYFSTHVGSNGGLVPGSPEDLSDGRGTVVPTFRLDDLVSTPVHFIKVDVEGAEPRAVLGGEHLIKEHRPMVTSELSAEMMERVSRVSPGAYLQFFTDLDYQVFVIERDSGDLTRFAEPARLLDRWDSDPLRIEDILLLPG